MSAFAALRCDRCGYDLRAQPEDGKCPECGASVEESRRLAAIPRRPRWLESDPRWRRRILAGVWVLVLLPLMDVLKTFGWASSVPVPVLYNSRETVHALNDTFLNDMGVYQLVVFCIGVVLLFSKERGRRQSRLDWTRPWGVICSYVAFPLGAAQMLIVVALVMAGIAALFQSMPSSNQPKVTQLFVDISSSYLRYGPYPREISAVVLLASSSIAILLACIPLFDALRSNGPRWLAAALLTPLVFFSLMHLAQSARYCLGSFRRDCRRRYSLRDIFQSAAAGPRSRRR